MVTAIGTTSNDVLQGTAGYGLLRGLAGDDDPYDAAGSHTPSGGLRGHRLIAAVLHCKT